MKKLINGKLYDTETAKQLGSYDNGYPGNDFRWMFEALYKKRNGEFFLAGRGGAMSKYSKSRGNMLTDGSGVIPLDIDEAKRWAEAHLDTEDYMKLFGEPEE